MKPVKGVHSTNYTNALILPAPDCRAPGAAIPPTPGSVAGQQYALLAAAPYAMTSDDLLCAVTAARKDVPNDGALRAALFAKGQPCLRASPLAKTYGWAFHHDASGRVALVDLATAEGRALAARTDLSQVAAMRTSRA